MKLIHNIRLNATLKTPEEREETIEAIQKLIKQPLIEETTNEDLSKINLKTLYLTSIYLTKQTKIKELTKNLFSQLPKKDLQRLQEEFHTRLAHGRFHFRINREELINKKKVLLTDRGDVIQASITLAAFPKTSTQQEEVFTNLCNTFK